MPDQPPNAEDRRIQALTSRLCDQHLSPEEMEELTDLLRGKPEHIAAYCEITSQHLDLSLELRAPIQVTPSDLAEDQKTKRRTIFNRWQKTFLAIAAAFLVALVPWWMYGPSEPDFTARIVQKIDCSWGGDHWGGSQPGILDAGSEIDLERGLMLVEFSCGAQVMLEGPVQFTVLADNRGRLEQGKITAHVDKRGHGFAVEMPGIQLVDLGTRFGAAVTQAGLCEAHVFEGNVLLSTDLPDSENQEWNLSRGQAVRYDSTKRIARRIAAKPQAFVHADRLEQHGLSGGAITDGGWNHKSLVLRFQAGKQLQLDESDHVVTWGNLVHVESNQQDRNAWQVDHGSRPKYVWDEARQLSALRFDGNDHLKITPFSTKSDLTIFCAFRCPDVTAQGCILDLSGPEGLWLGDSPLSRSLAGQIVIAASTYKHSDGHTTLYLNGRSVRVSDAGESIFSALPKVIGATSDNQNPFVGDLYELTMVSDHLSEEECRSECAKWMRNYDIAPDDAEPRILAHPHSL